MSSALAMAAVTAVLKDLLNDGLINHVAAAVLGSDVTVSALPPDVVAMNGAGQTARLNLFLYYVSPNPGWRNVGLPAFDARGDRVANPPLALDLHYLLTAYGAADLHAELLLGWGMQLFHETPILTRDAIRAALDPSLNAGGNLPQALQSLSAEDLTDQVESIKLCPETLNVDEISKIWTAFQTHYRPTAAFQVSVVLIESKRPARAPLPVLTRGPGDAGVVVEPGLTPPFPTLTDAVPPNRQEAVRLGESLTLQGNHLDADRLTLRFMHPLLNAPNDISIPQSDRGAGSIRVSIPDQPDGWPAGIWTATALVQPPGGAERATNSLPFALAPAIRTAPPVSATRAGATVTVKLHCRPEVRPDQRVSLLLGAQEIPAEEHAAQTNALTFVSTGIAPGDYPLRLRVDGVDSILIDRTKNPPVFDGSQKVTAP
ncbi:MAG TPA: DUF4255 domain-containing protein [Armatimonadota bacterium]|jgi:hypothetical protein